MTSHEHTRAALTAELAETQAERDRLAKKNARQAETIDRLLTEAPDRDEYRARCHRMAASLESMHIERDRLAEANARLEVERDDARALVAACTTTEQRRLAETIRKVRALTLTEDGHPLHPSKRVSVADLVVAVGDIPSPAASTTGPEVPASDDQPECGYCGAWLRPGWRYCPGHFPVEPEETTDVHL